MSSLGFAKQKQAQTKAQTPDVLRSRLSVELSYTLKGVGMSSSYLRAYLKGTGTLKGEGIFSYTLEDMDILQGYEQGFPEE